MSKPNINRDTLVAHVTTFLVNNCQEFEASEYGAADSHLGTMNGDPLGAFRFSTQGAEGIPVDPSRKYKGKFCIDEANGRAIVSYKNTGFLSGWGGAWQIHLDGTVETLLVMKR